LELIKKEEEMANTDHDKQVTIEEVDMAASMGIES